MKTIKDLAIEGKRVLVRVDVNVPMDQYQNITDDSRVRAVLPTLRYVLDHNAKLIVASHMGRPEGRVVPELSLGPVAKRLGRLLEISRHCISSAAIPTRIPLMALKVARRSSVMARTVLPWSGRYCLGVDNPIRVPVPAAGTIAQIPALIDMVFYWRS